MKSEHKQDLIGLCKIEIMRWKAVTESNPNMIYMVELMETAMAALTAPPIKLPEKMGPSYASVALSTRDEQWYAAVRAAGYEVVDEDA